MAQAHRIFPRFVGEQDGPYERLLKEKLAAAFLNDGFVGRAYLAQADLQDGTGVNVILALRTSARNEQNMADGIGAIFAPIFHADVHLDILFLKEHSEAEVQKICKPFFERDRHTTITIN